MGFWGVKVLAKTDVPVGESAVVRDVIGGEMDGSWAEPSGWQIASFHGAEMPQDDAVRSLAQAFNAPVMTASIFDSDFGIIQFATGDTPVAYAVLHPRMAAEMGMSALDESDPARVAQAISAWAGEGGDETRIGAALGRTLVFAEDTFLVLASACGAFPEARLADYVFGGLDDLS